MYGFQVGPVVLGMILGPLMDRSYRQAMLSTGNDVGLFITEFFTTPLSAILLAALVLTLVSQTAWWKRLRGRA
jgi:putative tricarboxylic transport membrane protein